MPYVYDVNSSGTATQIKTIHDINSSGTATQIREVHDVNQSGTASLVYKLFDGVLFNAGTYETFTSGGMNGSASDNTDGYDFWVDTGSAIKLGVSGHLQRIVGATVNKVPVDGFTTLNVTLNQNGASFSGDQHLYIGLGNSRTWYVSSIGSGIYGRGDWSGSSVYNGTKSWSFPAMNGSYYIMVELLMFLTGGNPLITKIWLS